MQYYMFALKIRIKEVFIYICFIEKNTRKVILEMYVLHILHCNIQYYEYCIHPCCLYGNIYRMSCIAIINTAYVFAKSP